MKRSGTSAWWVCACDCGKTTLARSAELRNGHVGSCGCYRAIKAKKLHHKHGAAAANQPEYRTWKAIKRRCYNVRTPDYPDWGGRGIRVCDAWLNDFQAFLRDVGPRPSPKHSIDRIDNDGHYEPSNVRWSTNAEQANNRRRRQEWQRDADNGRFISSFSADTASQSL